MLNLNQACRFPQVQTICRCNMLFFLVFGSLDRDFPDGSYPGKERTPPRNKALFNPWFPVTRTHFFPLFLKGVHWGGGLG